MLTFEQAKRIGINACIEKLGVEFVRKYADTSSSAVGYGDDEKTVFCFVGVDDGPQAPFDGKTLTLTSDDAFPYSASCEVVLETGKIENLEYITI